jgi:hypothetical protein
MLASYEFDRQLRADRRFNITARLACLMVVLSHRHGFASMSVDRMAEELCATPESVRQARRKLVALKLFEGDKWRFKPLMLPGEDKEAFWRRVRADRRLDLTFRLAWFLCDETRRDGGVKLSVPEVAAHLGAATDSAAWAIDRIRRLGYFTIATSRGRGKKTTFTRIEVEQPQYQQQVTEIPHDDEDYSVDYTNFQRRSRGTDRSVAGGGARDTDERATTR